jgi:3D (Asp-Asp-Asp) domain-containing protein
MRAIKAFTIIFIGLLVSGYCVDELQQPDQSLDVKAVCIGTMKVTAYRSVKSQTDDSPYWTSIGIRTNPFIVAVSLDLLKNGTLQYGDLIYIEHYGFKHVADVMNKKNTNSVDIWVDSYSQEKLIGTRHLKVWLVKGKTLEM